MTPNEVGGMIQWAALALGGLGFSAAPWIAALLTGKLRPISWVREQLADRDAQIATWQGTARVATERADRLAVQLAEVAGESGQTAVHLLKSLPGGGDRDEHAE